MDILLKQVEEKLREALPLEVLVLVPPQLQENLLVVLLAAASLAIVIATVLLRSISGGSKGSARTVLLVGGCGAGKTSMWKKLEGGREPMGYVTSMQENEARVDVGGKTVRLVDLPGHPRARTRLAEALESASCIVYVIDSTEFAVRHTEVAELLMDVLASRAVQSRRVPVLVACNKQDQTAKANSLDFIRKRLEKQIETLRGTRAALGESGTKGKGGVVGLGKPGEPFSLSQCPSRVEVAPTSVVEGTAPGLDAVRDFIKKYA